jgi:predicted phage tail component-like protein
MPNGFTLKGQHCSELGIAMETKTLPVLANPDDSYIQAPGRDGSYLFARELSDSTITIVCGLLTSDTTELMTIKRQIAAWVYSKETIQLVFDDEPDKFYLVKYNGTILLDQSKSSRLGTFTLVFRSDPVAYSKNDKTLVLTDFLVTNEGTALSFPKFTVTFSNPATEFKLALGSEFVRVVKNFAVNDVLIIDHTISKVIVNGVSAMAYLDWQDSKFFSLPTGLSQLIATPAGAATVTINYTERWL